MASVFPVFIKKSFCSFSTGCQTSQDDVRVGGELGVDGVHFYLLPWSLIVEVEGLGDSVKDLLSCRCIKSLPFTPDLSYFSLSPPRVSTALC